MNCGLVLGTFDLVDNSSSSYTVETLAEGTDFGNPQPIEVAIRSLLQDGSIVAHQGDDNREVPLRVVITAPDAVALDEGTAALRAELYRRNTLTYTPPRDYGSVRVFDVITSSLERVYDDLAEVTLGERYFSIKLTCEPFGRKDTETVTEALAASGSTTEPVDDCTSATGWTGTPNAPTVISGAVTEVDTIAGDATLTLTRTGAIDTSVTPYLVVDWVASLFHGSLAFRVYADGVLLARVSNAYSPTAGYFRSTYLVEAASVAVLRVEADTSDVGVVPPNTATQRNLYVENISRTDIRPLIGTARQLLRALPVAGSARTPARLTLEHETSALGDAMIYAFQDTGVGYQPALRPALTSAGSTTSDAGLVSGARNMLDTQMVFDVPARSVPAGSYLLLARLRDAGFGGGAVTLTVTTRTRINSTDVGTVTTKSVDVVLPTGQGWTNFTLCKLMLGTAPTAANIRITIVDSDTGGIDVELDEAWLFHTKLGRLVQVSCGTGAPAAGGPSNRVFLLPATVDRPSPTVLRGFAADASDAFYPGADVIGWKDPVFAPPSVALFTVTPNALNADASAAYYERAAD